MSRLPLGKVLACGALMGAWAVTAQTVGAACAQGSCPSDSGDDVALLQRAKQAGAAAMEHSAEKQEDAQGRSWGPVSASKVCVWNKGGYALEYKIQDAAKGWVIAQTSPYPNPQTKCTDLRVQAGVEPGEEFAVWVTAIGGKTVTADHGVKYNRFGPEVTFKCTGSTTMIQCDLVQGITGVAEDAVTDAVTQPSAPLTGRVQSTMYGGALPASRVCVWNKGGYALNYRVQDAENGMVVAQTSNYPNPQTKCTDLRSVPGVYIDEQFIIWVSAVAGSTVTTNPGIKYHPNAATLTFKCTGSTTTIQCNFESVS